MRDFRTLKVWGKAHELALSVYKATRSFPKEEMYGLTSQIRRAAYSIPANLAEGCGRDGPGELGRFVRLQWAQPANWNTTCCCRMTWIYWKNRLTRI